MGGSGHSRRLKVLHLDPERRWGGGETQVLGLLGHLAAKGHRNDLLTHPDGLLWRRCQRLEIRTLPLVMRNDLDLRSVWGLRRLIRRGGYDIVHFHTKRAHALSFWLPRKSSRPKYLVTRRMDYPEKRNFYTCYLYNRCVDGIVAISLPIVQLLLDAGINGERIRLIHSGVDITQFDGSANNGRAGGMPVIGSLAVLEERKGHRFLLEALARLKAKGVRVRCLLAGEGSERKSLEDMIEQLALDQEVCLVGFVADTPAFLREIDIFALPSLHEGFGVAALEAMAAGKAIVASRVGGLTEMITDGVTGILVPPQNSEALGEAIGRLVADSSQRQAMGRRAAVHVREHFTLEGMAARNEAYYYELLEGRA